MKPAGGEEHVNESIHSIHMMGGPVFAALDGGNNVKAGLRYIVKTQHCEEVLDKLSLRANASNIPILEWMVRNYLWGHGKGNSLL